MKKILGTQWRDDIVSYHLLQAQKWVKGGEGITGQ